MATQREKLTEKIQVLLTKDDIHELNQIICRKALEEKRRPEPISSYIRDLIKKDISDNQPEQVSYVKKAVQKSTKN